MSISSIKKFKNVKFKVVLFADSETTTLKFTETEKNEIFLNSDKYNDLCKKSGFDEITDDMFTLVENDYYFVFSYVWYVTELNAETGKKQYYFRTRSEFSECVENLSNTYNVLVYYHNLSYDMRYLNFNCEFTKHFKVEKITAYSAATPLCYELKNKNSGNTISVRDSAKLFTMSIKNIGDLIGFKKLDYNYSTVRYIDTELSATEIEYGIRDTEIMQIYFCKKYGIEFFSGISNNKVALTSTGETRKYIKKLSNRSDTRIQYKDLKEICTTINNDLQKNPEKFNFCKLAYFGGLCFSNHARTGKIISEKTHSIDLTSSYPSAMIYGEYANGIMERETIENATNKIEFIKKLPLLFVIKNGYKVLNRSGRGFIARLRLTNVHLKRDKNMNIFPCILTRKTLDAKTLEKLSDTIDIENMMNILPNLNKANVLNNKLVSTDIHKTKHKRIFKKSKNKHNKKYKFEKLKNAIEIFVTNIDFFIMLQCYNIEKIDCIEMYSFPVKKIKFWETLIDEIALTKQFHKIMIDDIENKKIDITKNFDIETYENEYGCENDDNLNMIKNTEKNLRLNTLKKLIYTKQDKGRLNGLYGINVQNPMQKNYIINQIGHLKKCTVMEFSSNEFTSFLLGLFITSYSRLQLFAGYVAIQKTNGKHVYSDTDSHKFIGDKEKTVKLATKICNDLMMCKNHELNKKYGFGNYDLEKSYDKFYTLGSKFYITEIDKKIHGTISGVTDIDEILNYNHDDFETTINLFCKPNTTLDKTITELTGQLQHYIATTGILLLNSNHTICKQTDVYKKLKLFSENDYNGQTLKIINNKIQAV